MSRNGSGTYTLPAGNPTVTGTTISSAWANNTLSDIATALTQSVSADGQTPITANLPMNSKKITGLAAATVVGDALSYGQSGMGAFNGTTGTFSGAITSVDYTFSGVTSGTFKLSATGVPYGSALHNNSGAVTGTTNQYICSGTYTPTGTAGAGIASITSATGKWTRLGNVVNCAVEVSLSTSGAGTATFDLSLPIASNLAAVTDLLGVMVWGSTFGAGTVIANTVNHRATLTFTSAGAAGQLLWATFAYEVL